MGELRTHPAEPVQPPVWRGVSDLAGDIGDNVQGTYQRSINAYVRNATTIAKRRGFTRAFDERFVGAASLISHRSQDGTRYQVVGDGDGIKVLTNFTPRPQPGDFFDHVGFPDDDFDLRTATEISSGAVSGSNPYEPWTENGGTSPVGGDFTLNGTSGSAVAVQITRASSGSAYGTMERPLVAPSPFYVVLAELDLTSCLPATSYDDLWQFNLGMPDRHIFNGTAYNARVFMADSLWLASGTGKTSWVPDTAMSMWSGMVVSARVHLVGSNYQLHVQMAACMADRNSGSAAGTINGYIVRQYMAEHFYSFANLAALQDTHTFEFGREEVSPTVSGQTAFRQRCRVWIGKAKNEIDFGVTDPDIDLEVKNPQTGRMTVDEGYTNNNGQTFINVLPFGTGAAGRGFFGVYGKATYNAAASTMNCNFLEVSNGFR